MSKNKNKATINQTDKLLSDQNRNRQQYKKPLPIIGVIIISLAAILFLIILLVFADCFSVNQATVLGMLGTTCISLFAVFYSINRDTRENYREAKRNAGILAQLLHSTENQIMRIENGMISPILYSQDWIRYYESCAVYLRYDYLEYLLSEFELVERINSCINNDDADGLKAVLNIRRQTISDNLNDFDILSVGLNLSFFSMGAEEDKSWKFKSEYQEFEKFFIDNYTERTKELTIEYLKANNGTCDENSAEQYVMNKLREEAGLKTGKYKYEATENKKMRRVIFKVYLSLDKNDPFSLCWGELTLKD